MKQIGDNQRDEKRDANLFYKNKYSMVNGTDQDEQIENKQKNEEEQRIEKNLFTEKPLHFRSPSLFYPYPQ
jgi:hypothetical protein